MGGRALNFTQIITTSSHMKLKREAAIFFYVSHLQLGIEHVLNVCCALAFKSWVPGSLHFPQRKQIKIWHLSQLPLISSFFTVSRDDKTAKYSSASGGWNLSTSLSIPNIIKVGTRGWWCSLNEGTVKSSPPINCFLSAEFHFVQPC